ncbi:hypothetical protein CAPTEDRAFT_108216 [Capitella teleta]|uniref:CMP domain-containing protein n=1 Tax=Capitella teleta TaxID=283909 RepID=R7TTE4_CAPTE|nr:hypothetical protein CAPTEDRAFT_108216 [Capitella teleta]|eukprot:ELT97178.1 hypothetical protein CAPTEDRAFT_108216 [Capitella teleta]
MVSNNDLITYALVPGSTRIGDLVTTALTKIGFTSTQAVGAKGSLQVKDWKPLTFDLISENPDATADEILGDIAGMVTLRIRLRRFVSRAAASP